ncbi:rac GTPase-activating protein 1-like isoform X2 [Pomacea canaliculata]|uniref:rac GTPase-activating protein 1-like isoform X2 n=1 Tax=Pomacea canaliculata TaxID=400727 RepID=UPI000D7273F2|nr:rac GTPase-activating protein 1-like isoform X2 [Pomacea canaliculata]
MEGKLSLVAAFDDLMRTAGVLNAGCEGEFRTFVLHEDTNRRRWLAAEQKNESREDRVKRLEAEKAKLETQVKHARNQVQYELQRKNEAEQGKAALERQLEMVRELLMDKNSKSYLADADRERLHNLYNGCSRPTGHGGGDKSPGKLNTILESSASVLSDISYDKTEDDLETSHLRSGRRWKRPSAPPADDLDVQNGNTPPKRHKDDLDNSIVTTTTITVDNKGKPISATTEVTVPKLNKSFSEPALDKHLDDSDDDVWVAQEDTNNNRRRRGILKKTPDAPGLRKASSAGRGLNRVHVFLSRTVIKPTTCVPCGKNIRFGKVAMKCKDCRASCHPECKDKLPLPCIPSAPSTPGTSKLSEGTVADFSPVQRPMIPRLVVNCANEVERRGLSEIGIYRVPGSDRDSKELKEKFIKGKSPNLSNISDIHTVCCCLKDFLRNLKEPIVTYSRWPEFVRSAEHNSQQASLDMMCEAVNSLPTANRDTLAFLIQHLQKVAASPACKMPITNLAKVFGPTIVGYSCQEPQPMQMINETRKQAMVVERLLELPTDFWSKILDVDDISLYPADTPYTPGSPIPPVLHSRLGPVLTPGAYEKLQKSQIVTEKNATTPRLMPPLFRHSSVSESAV